MVQRDVGKVFVKVVATGVLAWEGVIGAGHGGCFCTSIASQTHGSVWELVDDDGCLV